MSQNFKFTGNLFPYIEILEANSMDFEASKQSKLEKFIHWRARVSIGLKTWKYVAFIEFIGYGLVVEHGRGL